MELGLSNAVVAIFGAASGIGTAIARAFAARRLEGRRSRPQSTRRRSRRQLPGAISLVVDVGDYAIICRAAEQITDRVGPCDHVVYAVGCGSGKFGFPFWKLAPSDWDAVLKVNLLGVVNVAHAFAPAMALAHSAKNSDRRLVTVVSLSVVGRGSNRIANRPTV